MLTLNHFYNSTLSFSSLRCQVVLPSYLCEDRLLVSSQEVRPLEDVWEETTTQRHPAQLPWDKEGDAEQSQTTGGHQQGQQAHRYI